MGTVNRRPYEDATVLDQDLLGESHDNLTIRLEMVAEIEDVGSSDEDIFISDRAKYVGGTFYEPRTEFPIIERTIGDWLAGTIEFSNLELTINNSDEKYSHLLPGGSDYDGFIGRRITVKAGLAEELSTYNIVFSGEITDVSGFSRDTTSFTLVARSDFERVNVTIPNQVLIEDDFPNIEDEFIGLGAPVVYGDWTVDIRTIAPEVPAFPVNGLDANVIAGTSPLRCVISSTPIKTLDTSSITLFRGDAYYTFAPGDIAIVGGTDNTIFDITQMNLLIDGSPWIYESGDQFFVKCVGVDLSGNEENLVTISQDLLERFGGLVPGDFDASWATIEGKAAPAESAVANIRGRVWLQESQNLMEYVLSLLEQIRVEAYVDRLNKFHLSTLHFEDFTAVPNITIKNWHVARGSFKPETDERNNWNRAKADFSFSPVTGEARFSTAVYRNNAAITQWGREISKLVAFPNLIVLGDVEDQLQEMLKLASCQAEMINVDFTWYAQQMDISDEFILQIQIGSVDFINVAEPVTAKMRIAGYDPAGKIKAKVWSFQMVPFPGSLKAGVSGITGGSSATITKET